MSRMMNTFGSNGTFEERVPLQSNLSDGKSTQRRFPCWEGGLSSHFDQHSMICQSLMRMCPRCRGDDVEWITAGAPAANGALDSFLDRILRSKTHLYQTFIYEVKSNAVHDIRGCDVRTSAHMGQFSSLWLYLVLKIDVTANEYALVRSNSVSWLTHLIVRGSK